MTGRVSRYYDGFDEWGRLESPPGRLEFIRALDLVERYLAPESRILDLGAGPGRYAIEWARGGHRVSLADISECLLERARKQITAAGVGDQVDVISLSDAQDLRVFETGKFDAVAAFGPFYHLITDEARHRAASEVSRVLRKGGVVFAAFMPRMTGLKGLISRACTSPNQVSGGAFLNALENGVFINTTDEGFQEANFTTCEQMRGLFWQHHIRPIGIVSIRGLAFGCEEEVLGLREHSPKLFDELMLCIEQTETLESVIEFGGHAMFIGIRSGCPEAMSPSGDAALS